MSLRCSVIFCLFLAAQSALIKNRNIPVEIVYEKDNPSQFQHRNLDAKIQLTPDDLLKFKLSDEIIDEEKYAIEADLPEFPHGNPYGVRNLDERPQLSPEELGQATKFLPHVAETEESEKLAELDQKAVAPETKPENNNLLSLLKKAEEMAYVGMNSIKDNVNNASIAAVKPSSETWEKLNQTIEKFFKDQYRNVNLKDDNQNSNQNNNQIGEFFQNAIQNFQTTMTNTINNYFSQNNQSSGSEDEQQNQQNPFQNIVTNVFGFVVNGMNNLNSQNSTQGGSEDTGESSGQGGNVFTTMIGSIQQWFTNQISQGNNPTQSINGNQSDTGVEQPSNPNPFGFIQGAVVQVINSWQPTSSSKPAVEGDEGTGTTQSSNILGSISQAFQTGNLFGGQAPQGGGAGGSGGSNPISSAAQAIGGQFGQVVGGQGGSGGSAGGSNPITSGAQAIGSQIGQLTGGQGGEGGSNPITSGAQAAAGQLGQLTGGQGGSNPITSGAQAVGSQIGQLTGGQGGSNPIENLQNAIGGSYGSTEKTKLKDDRQDEGLNPSPTTGPKEKLEGEKKTPEIIEKVE